AIGLHENKRELPFKIHSYDIKESESLIHVLKLVSLEKAQNEKEELRTMIESMQDGFSVLDKNGMHLEVNPSFCKMLGMTKEELVGSTNPYPYWPPDKLGLLNELLYQVSQGTQQNQILEFIRKDKKRIPVFISPTRILDEAGNVKYYFSTYKDLSHQQDIENRLQKQETKFKLLFSEMLQGLAYFKIEFDENRKPVDAKLEEVNQAFLDIIGLRRGDLMGILLSQLYREECGWKDEFFQSLIDQNPKAVEHVNYYESIRKYIKLKASAIGEDHLLLMLEDITSSKLAEKATEKSAAEARLLFNESAVLIWEEDFSEAKILFEKFQKETSQDMELYLKEHPEKLKQLAGKIKILQVNQTTLDRYEVDTIEELNRHLPDWFTEKSWDSFRDKILAIFSGKVKYEGETPIRNPRGGIDDLYITVAVPGPYRKCLKKVLISFVDISKLKEYERSLEHNQKELSQYKDQLEALVKMRTTELEEANKELQSFSYSVSHDLRAPLNRIDGFARAMQLTYKDTLDEKGMHYLSRIRAGSQKMTALIKDLLMLSKINRLELEKKQVNLGEIATRVHCQLTEKEPERVVSFSVIGELEVYMDEGLANLMLENLIENAWKFSRGQGLSEIELGQTTVENRNCFYVRDNGIGFDEKFKEIIFTPFQRLHTNKDIEGSGIGLSTVKRIINKHGGTVWADSTPGEGSSFYFRL
ncbi:MAG: PAS domain S-box protein, partial [Bacteroidota bacterium]